ncbi:MAG: fasciclin domain-containing protein [Methanofollis sp.]|uniref:fasciclin domain-containing protein n=1 Tax=Methanofollis sp. TaxID=2052835 RepID=UPI00260A09F6|nr:fasciclin domain-containing protein [Methanofollis sp.]MDD4255040.1 fasciclin domain-containing protein [Methanofollis sp.]
MQQKSVQIQKNIVETAVASGEFNTLVEAVKAAGLVETLSSPGPFTVFAPNDAAFSKVSKETLDSLMKDKAKLADVLKYHVISGKHMASDVAKMKSLKTLQGSDLSVDTSKGVKINDVNVIKADIVCSNGVCHVIDSVLIPK